MRVSKEEKLTHGVSLHVQLERIKAYAVMSGLKIAKVISEDGVTGAKRLDTRAGGAELAAIAGRTVQHVIALKLDRLFRDAEDALAQTRRWDRAGVTLHIIDMGGSALNTSSAMGRMFLTMTAAFAELERNLIAERTAAGLQHKKRTRKAYSPTPFGFTRDGDDLVVNPTEAEFVIELRKLRMKKWSYGQIAAECNRREIPTKRGGKRWYASTVQQILDNDIHK